MQAKKILEYKPDPNKFDLVTHRWDAQGHLVAKNPYRSYIIDGRQYFERPVNSGNLWFENNQPAGRVELTFGPNGKIAKKAFDFEAQHKDYVAPLTGTDALHYQLEQERERSAALTEELRQIRAERKIEDAVKGDGLPPADASGAAPTLRKRNGG